MKQVSKAQAGKHLVFIDYLRAFACLSVVFLHVVVDWTEKSGLTVAEYPLRLKIDAAICGVLRVAVPIFVMISGALLLDKNKEISWQKIKKYITKMLVVLLVFGLGFCFIENFANHVPLWQSPFVAIKNLLEENTWGHMWYIYMLIGLYVITPLVKPFTDRASKKDFQIMLGLLSVPVIIVPSINWLLNSSLTTFHISSLIYFFYYLLGQYIIRYPIKNSHAIVIFLVTTISLIALELLTEHHLTGSKYGSVPIAIIASTLFSLFSKMNLKSNIAVNVIARDSFAIYIIHVFWIHIMEMLLGIQLKNSVPVFGEITIYISIFAASIISAEAIRRLPGLRRII